MIKNQDPIIPPLWVCAEQINEIFELPLIDTEFIQLFQARFFYDFLYQVHYIRKVKNKNDKKLYIEHLQDNTNQLLMEHGRPKINLNNLENSKKTTDFVNIIRDVLLHDSQSLNQFMKLRKEWFNLMKQKKKLQQKKIQGFCKFYQVILQGNTTSTSSNLQKTLLGIQKLLRQGKSIRKDVHDRRNKLYQTNRTIKDILEYSLVINSLQKILKQGYDFDPQFSKSIQRVLEDKKWLGPNLYKILRKQKWRGYEIDMLADMMELSMKKQPKFRTERTKPLITRTINNIRKYSQFVKENPHIPTSFRLISSLSNLPSVFFSMQDVENPILRSQHYGREPVRIPSRNNITDQYDNQDNSNQH